MPLNRGRSRHIIIDLEQTDGQLIESYRHSMIRRIKPVSALHILYCKKGDGEYPYCNRGYVLLSLLPLLYSKAADLRSSISGVSVSASRS